MTVCSPEMVSVPPGNTLCADADEMNVVEDNTRMDAAITQREEFRDFDMCPTPRRLPWRLCAKFDLRIRLDEAKILTALLTLMKYF